jgi:hypothetical protein
MGYVTSMLVIGLLLITIIVSVGLYTKQAEHLQLVKVWQERNQFEVLKGYTFQRIDTLLQYHTNLYGRFSYNGGDVHYFSKDTTAVIRITLGSISVVYQALVKVINGKRKLTNIWLRRQ